VKKVDVAIWVSESTAERTDPAHLFWRTFKVYATFRQLLVRFNHIMGAKDDSGESFFLHLAGSDDDRRLVVACLNGYESQTREHLVINAKCDSNLAPKEVKGSGLVRDIDSREISRLYSHYLLPTISTGGDYGAFGSLSSIHPLITTNFPFLISTTFVAFG
jgi:hypothetical protein